MECSRCTELFQKLWVLFQGHISSKGETFSNSNNIFQNHSVFVVGYIISEHYKNQFTHMKTNNNNCAVFYPRATFLDCDILSFTYLSFLHFLSLSMQFSPYHNIFSVPYKYALLRCRHKKGEYIWPPCSYQGR